MKLKTSLSKGSKSPSIIDSYIELYSLESRNLFPQSIERLRTGTTIIIPTGYIGCLLYTSPSPRDVP